MPTDPHQDRRKRRIVFVNRFFYPNDSATSQILTDLASHLAQAGYSVSVVTSDISEGRGRGDKRQTHRGVTIRRIWTTHLGQQKSWRRIVDLLSFYPSAFIALLRRIDRDTVLIVKTDPPLISVVAAIAAKIRGATVVNWLQDLYPEVAGELSANRLARPLVTLLQPLRNWSLGAAHTNVVIGRRMNDRLGEFRISKLRTLFIPNWADEQAITPLQASASRTRRKWGYGDNDFVVGYSGNLGRAHEADTLLQAAKLLKDNHSVHFLVVGGGREQVRLQTRVRELGLARFRFEDYQPREDLSDALAAADVHWLSLKPNVEGLIVPSKFYCILAAGRPLIAVCAPDGEVSCEIARLGCGIQVTPGDGQGMADAILVLVNDPALREQMGSRARRLAESELSRGHSLALWEGLLSREFASAPSGRQDLADAVDRECLGRVDGTRG